MKALGLPPGRHQLGELAVDIFDGRGEAGGEYDGLHAVLAGTATLAGAVVPLDQCLRNLLAFTGCSPQFALATVTTHPAAMLGLQGVLGSLAVGAWADLTLLDDSLHVRQVYLAGQVAWTRGM